MKSQTSASLYSNQEKVVHASNPNPQLGERTHPEFNQTMYNTYMGEDVGAHKRGLSVKNSDRLPFPFVSGLLGGHAYTKPGK